MLATTTRHSDDALAAHLAEAAGRLLLELRETAGLTGQRLGAGGDAAAHAYLAGRLGAERPYDAVLSEEGADDPKRLGAERVWIVDPLDGTREYSEGRPDWAVHVALHAGGRLVAGAVALPDQNLVLAAPSIVRARPAARPRRIVVSRTRPPATAATVAAALGAEVLPMGSAGAKTAAVIFGDAEAYIHAGGQYEWDSAAPAAVAAAAGLHVSRLDGSPLSYNNPSPYLPDLLVCVPSVRDRILEVTGGGGVPAVAQGPLRVHPRASRSTPSVPPAHLPSGDPTAEVP